MSDAEHEYLLEAMRADGATMFAPWIMQLLRKRSQEILGRPSPAMAPKGKSA